MDKENKNILKQTISNFINDEIACYFIADDELQIIKEIDSRISLDKLFDAFISYFMTRSTLNIASFQEFQNVNLRKEAFQLLKYLKEQKVFDESLFEIEGLLEVAIKFVKVAMLVGKDYLTPFIPQEQILSIIQQFVKSMTEIGYVFGGDPKEIIDMLQINELFPEALDTEASTPAKTQKRFYTLNKMTLGQLNKLAKILQEDYGCIKYPASFVNLFTSNGKSGVAYWNKDKIKYLARLIYELMDREWIDVGGSGAGRKPFFKIAQLGFVDFSKKELKSDLKKMSSRIQGQPHKYASIIENVDAILDNCQK